MNIELTKAQLIEEMTKNSQTKINTPTNQKAKTPEETLKEKLNATEKANLDFFKEGLNDENKFNQFVLLNEVKIKAALEHIRTELENCNDEQKNTFKEGINGYFSQSSQIDDNALDGFKTGLNSLCNMFTGG
ncbi:Mlp family lipoprotein (plasmid) [Borrelia miyamotoi]|uniref:Mlp family lipoprotein n=1 Tax=Borrelia miyamotoi TaxID=47466 RepID=A0AAX3JNL6_9SPIR|nr:Mlp family lipoprotein [Borrelia miyamotoi]WAZ72492.1 Mlp family lipoprotein [Borrelia miyamotoi]